MGHPMAMEVELQSFPRGITPFIKNTHQAAAAKDAAMPRHHLHHYHRHPLLSSLTDHLHLSEIHLDAEQLPRRPPLGLVMAIGMPLLPHPLTVATAQTPEGINHHLLLPLPPSHLPPHEPQPDPLLHPHQSGMVTPPAPPLSPS